MIMKIEFKRGGIELHEIHSFRIKDSDPNAFFEVDFKAGGDYQMPYKNVRRINLFDAGGDIYTWESPDADL